MGNNYMAAMSLLSMGCAIARIALEAGAGTVNEKS